MILTNFLKAILIQYNRGANNSPYDDEDTKEVSIKLCPYNADDGIKFDIYSISEATGYFIVKGNVDIKEGDQIIFRERTYTVLKVKDNWIFNKIVNISVVVK